MRVVASALRLGMSRIEPVKCNQAPALEVAQRARDGLARGADEFADFFVRQGEAEARRAAFGRLAVLAPLEQQAGKFFGR